MGISSHYCCQKCGFKISNPNEKCPFCGYKNIILDMNLETQTIKLKEDLLKVVKEGNKKATTCLGIKRYRLGDAFLVNPHDNNDSIKIKINQFKIIQYKEINDDLARIENYNTKEELKNVLKEIYPNIQDEDFLTVVFFKLA